MLATLVPSIIIKPIRNVGVRVLRPHFRTHGENCTKRLHRVKKIMNPWTNPIRPSEARQEEETTKGSKRTTEEGGINHR